MIRTLELPLLTAVGSAGSAAGSVRSGGTVAGKLLAIKVVQGNSPHANTDITITQSNGSLTQTILTLTNNNTASAWYYTRGAASDQAGVALVFAGTDPVPVEVPLFGQITATVAEGGSDATCAVSLVYEV